MHRNIDRRRLMKTAGAMALVAGAGAVRSDPAFAQQVPWSSGTESPRLKAPANACDCHMHIYDAKYPADPKATLKPADALVADYKLLQKRIGTSRNVVVTPSTYGTDNRVTLDAIAQIGPTARGVAVVDATVTDAELKRLNGLGVRGIRFNLVQAGATTAEMIEPLSRRVNDLGWHIQLHMKGEQIAGIEDLLLRVPSRSCSIISAGLHSPTPSTIRVSKRSASSSTWEGPGSSCLAPIRTPRSGRPPIRTRWRSPAPISRQRPSAWCGPAIGRIRPRRTSPTTRSCSACSPNGRRTKRCARASWCRTRPRSTASRRRRDRRAARVPRLSLSNSRLIGAHTVLRAAN